MKSKLPLYLIVALTTASALSKAQTRLSILDSQPQSIRSLQFIGEEFYVNYDGKSDSSIVLLRIKLSDIEHGITEHSAMLLNQSATKLDIQFSVYLDLEDLEGLLEQLAYAGSQFESRANGDRFRITYTTKDLLTLHIFAHDDDVSGRFTIAGGKAIPGELRAYHLVLLTEYLHNLIKELKATTNN